jgi:ResB-like family protein
MILAGQTPTPQPHRTPPGGRLWAFVSSVKVGVALLVCLAVASIVGTVVESKWDTDTAQRWVYHSLWFIGLMALTVLNLIAATWNTTRVILMLPWSRPLITQPEAFRALAVSRTIAGQGNPDRLRQALARHIGPVSGEGAGMFAQRGIFQRWGAVITHVGILLLLAGGIWLSLSAHLGGAPGGAMLWIGEGMTRDWYLAPDPDSPGRNRLEQMPFTVRLHDFDADYFPNTQIPRAFTSTIELFPGDGTSSFHPVNMNVALRWRGWKFSQSSFAMLDESLGGGMERFLGSMDQRDYLRLRGEGRLEIHLADARSGQRLPRFDAAPGVRVSIPQSDLMFETPNGREFRILSGETVIASGPLGESDAAIAHNHSHADEGWAVRIDALHPNYRRTAEGHSSDGAGMTNPALQWTLLSHGEPVGSDLAFHSAQFRDMHFNELPVTLTFERYNPTSLLEWREGEAISLDVAVTDRHTEERHGLRDLTLGEVRDLAPAVDVPEPTAEVEIVEIPSVGPYTAAVAGRLPAAYSGLSVMRESMGLRVFFYLSFLLFLLGPFVAFGFTHCRVWAWVDPSGNRILIGGQARGRRARLEQLLDHVENDLTEDRG